MIMVRMITVVKAAVRIRGVWVGGDPGFRGAKVCGRGRGRAHLKVNIRTEQVGIKSGTVVSSPPPFTATVGSTGKLRARKCMSLASNVTIKNQSVIQRRWPERRGYILSLSRTCALKP